MFIRTFISLCVLATIFYTTRLLAAENTSNQQGIAFSAPYLTLHGAKDSELRLRIWARYTSLSPDCRGASIKKDGDIFKYVPGSSDIQGVGRANLFTYIEPGEDTYSAPIPLTITGPWQCDWKLYEAQMFIFDPYSGMDNPAPAEAIFFCFSDAPEVAHRNQPIADRYDITCSKFFYESLGEMERGIDCSYPSQKSQSTLVTGESVYQGKNTIINLHVSQNQPKQIGIEQNE